MPLDIQELKQRAQASAAFGGREGTLTLTWSEALEIIEELENLEAEKSAAEDDLGSEQSRVDSLEAEMLDLQDSLDEERHKLAQLEATSKCRECGGALHAVCDDCFHSGGR